MRTLPLIGASPCFVGLTLNAFLNPAATTVPSYGVNSVLAENGGNWTIYFRGDVLGALVKVDTGVAPGPGAHQIDIRYDDTTNPAIECFIDGVSVDRRVGLANVPRDTVNILGSQWTVGYVQGLTAGGAAGQFDWFRNARLTLTELLGFAD